MAEGLFDDRHTAEADRFRRTREQARGFAESEPGRPQPASKRLLVTVSHAIEQAVLRSSTPQDMVVVALFQRGSYFARERATYRRIAETGALVVIAHSDAGCEVPAGVMAVTVADDEPLADEWSVVAVSPSAGGYLVATDQHRIDPTELGWETGRQFSGRWGFSRVQAASELARLRAALGARLPLDTAAVIDATVSASLPAGGEQAAGTGSEAFATACLGHLTARLHEASVATRGLTARLVDAERAVDAQARAGIDPSSGLPTGELLARWTSAAAGPMAGRTALTLGLALVDLPGLAGAPGAAEPSPRDAFHAARRVAACLSQPLGPVDVALRLGAGQFLVVLPGATPDQLTATVEEITDQLREADAITSAVSLAGSIATTRTAFRPLPITDLHRAVHEPVPITSTGDPITVVVLPAVAAASSSAVEAAAAAAVESAPDAEPAADVEPAADAESGSPDRVAVGDDEPLQAPRRIGHPRPSPRPASARTGSPGDADVDDDYRAG